MQSLRFWDYRAALQSVAVTEKKGFTLIELLLVMTIASVLLGIATLNLTNVQRKSQLASTVNTFLADMKEQQIKAMVGDMETATYASAYGIRFSNSSYTIFRNSYGEGNYTITLPQSIQISKNFSTTDLLFEKGSGNVSGFSSASANTITLRDTNDGSQQVITLNRYGVVTNIQRQ